MKSWNEIGKNAAAFSKRWKAAHDEKRWRSSDFNFCMANVSKSNIRSMQTSAGITANGKELSQADLISIPADGYVFSNAELDALSSGEQLLVVEARQRNNLVVSVELDGAELYSYTAPLSISSIRQMYRWLNERYASGDNATSEAKPRGAAAVSIMV